MIRPNSLYEYLEKLRSDFPQFQKIFVTTPPNGTIVASTSKEQKDLNLFSCLTSCWDDYSIIGKLKFFPDEEHDKTPLQFQIVDFEKDKSVVILTSLQDEHIEIFLMGFVIKDRKELGFQLQKVKIIRELVQKELKGIMQNTQPLNDNKND